MAPALAESIAGIQFRDLGLPFLAVVLVFLLKMLIEAEPKRWPPIEVWAICSDLMVASIVAFLALLAAKLAQPQAGEHAWIQAGALVCFLLFGCFYERVLGKPYRDPTSGVGGAAIILGIFIPDFIGLIVAGFVLVIAYG